MPSLPVSLRRLFSDPSPSPSRPSRKTLFLSSLLFLSIILLLRAPFAKFHPASPFPDSANLGAGSSYTFPTSDNSAALNQTAPRRVAVIGAGASGTAAAFFLSRAARVVAERTGLEERDLLEVVVYEKEGYVGGRSTTVFPHSDPRTRAQELGASIFVESNRNMMKAVEYFNLTLVDPSYGEAGIGIWDGSSFLYTTSTSDSTTSSWLDTARALLRYGPFSYTRTTSAVSALLKKFADLYDPMFLAQRGVVWSIDDFAESVGLGRELTTRTGEDWALKVVGAGKRWMGEIMEGSTRVNYAEDMSVIHALGAGVSMATSGASQVEGGNWQVFRGFLDHSKAAVHLGVEVSDIVNLNEDNEDAQPQFQVVTNKTELNDERPFDRILFAAPLGESPVSKKFKASLEHGVPHQEYIDLHVTYLSTTKPHPDPEFFGLAPGSSVPNTIITSGSTSRATGVPPPRFQSITWHGEILPGSGEYAVKIFSLTRLTDRFISRMLGEDPSWLLRKEWRSYPALRPVAAYAEVQPKEGVEYLAALEPWISTMETQTLSAREAVARVVDEWWGLGLGECEDGDSWDWTC